MKPIHEMTQIEIAAFVQTHLEQNGIHVVLSGGAATGYFSQNTYVSADIDLVNEFSINRKRIIDSMATIGFFEVDRHFAHSQSQFVVEFPPGPLTVGIEPVKAVERILLETGTLIIISATDCVKDRLAAFYHWGDEQCLYQARLVKQHATIDLNEVKRWSIKEGKIKDFDRFLSEE